MFPKNQRITKKDEFDLIYKKGQSFYLDILGARILKNNLKIRRFAIIISTKISKKAVIRNKIKRQIRSILQQEQDNFPPSVDIIIYTKKGIEKLTFEELKKTILSLIQIINSDFNQSTN